jgi:hypothetical protein
MAVTVESSARAQNIKRPVLNQVALRLSHAGADTYYGFMYVGKTPAVIDSVEFLSQEPVAAGANTIDVFRRRAGADVAIVTQFDPDTLSAATLTSKAIVGGADLIAGDLIKVVAVVAGAALFDVTVIIHYRLKRYSGR